MANIKSKLNSRRFLLFAGIVILVVLLLVGVWFVFREPSQQHGDGEEGDIISELQIRAQEALAEGDVEGGLRIYNEGIEAAKDTTTKQNLLVSKAHFASSSGRTDEAIESAKSADALGPTPMTIASLARLYEANGNNQEAANHYQKLLDIIGPNVEGRNGSQDLRSEIERLRAL